MTELHIYIIVSHNSWEENVTISTSDIKNIPFIQILSF